MAKTPSQIKAEQVANSEQSRLKSFFDRRHPAYNDLIDHWTFLEDSYQGGRAWFQKQIFRYYKEGEKEFADRIERAYRFNHTREVVELVQKYLFKAKVSRHENASDTIKKFWKNASKNGLSIEQLMRQGSVANSIGGRSAIVIDNNFPTGITGDDGSSRPLSKQEAEDGKYRVYGYVVPAKNVLDYAFDEDGDGELLWVKLREVIRDDADPILSSGDFVYRVRLWTRTDWQVYEEVASDTATASEQAKTSILLRGRGEHKLGFVPVKLFDHTIGEDPYRVPGLIDDIGYLDRAVANYLSSLDAIIQDQTFSQLAIPAQSLMQGDDAANKIVEMGTKRIFTYDAGSGSSAKPEFLAPDPKQAGVILSVINKIISEIYHTIGLAGERTKEDNAVGIDNSSGVAKAYDFERVNSLLLAKAQSCEQVENWIVNTVLAWSGEEQPEDALVTYPTTFDVMRLADDLVTAEALAKLEAPIELRRQQMRNTADKMLPQMDDATKSKIAGSIDDWLEGTDVLPPPTAFGAAPAQKKPVAAPSRQGSVTSKTE